MTEKPDKGQEMPELSPKTRKNFCSVLAEMWPIFPTEILLSGGRS